MHRRDFLLTSAGLASLALPTPAFAARRGGSVHVSTVVPFRYGFAFPIDTGETAPISNVRFLFGGAPDLARIIRIQGQSGDIDGVFDAPGATPAEATRYFARHPFLLSAATAFWITVDAVKPSDQELQVTVVYD
jgi:hypothetical protein